MHTDPEFRPPSSTDPEFDELTPVGWKSGFAPEAVERVFMRLFPRLTYTQGLNDAC